MKYFHAKEKFKGTAREATLYKILYNALQDNSPQLPELLNDYLAGSTSALIKNEVEKNMKLHSDMREHQKKLANDDTYLVEYPSMQKVLWSDFLRENKGKAIYADFWASWCGPCIQERPNNIRLSADFKDRPVAFVFLSQDNSSEQWQKAVKKYNLSTLDNVYLLGGEQHSNILKHFNIQAILYYLVFDKNGNLLNKNAPKPSEPKIRDVLSTLICKYT